MNNLVVSNTQLFDTPINTIWCMHGCNCILSVIMACYHYQVQVLFGSERMYNVDKS